MDKKMGKFLLHLLDIFLLLFAVTDVTWAADHQFKFTADAILPNNQLSKVGYYDL